MHDDSRGGYRRGGGGHGGRGGRDGDRKPTPLSDLDPALTEVSRKAIGCAIAVHMGLGPGHDRDVYAKALKQELEAEGLSYVAGKSYPLEHRGETIGEAVADVEVDGRFLLMLVARPGDIGYERTQLRAQLRAADFELGLIMNFAERRMTDGLVRVLNPNKLNRMRDDEAQGDEGHDDSHGDEHEVDDEAPMAAPPEVQG